jgi:hypothetical protein
MRARLPGYAAERGIHRIEARAWSGHPTASDLLTKLGFTFEAELRGFGASGQVCFRQFAWITPAARSAPTSTSSTQPLIPGKDQDPCA